MTRVIHEDYKIPPDKIQEDHELFLQAFESNYSSHFFVNNIISFEL